MPNFCHVTRLRIAILTHWPSSQKYLAIRCGIQEGQLSHYARGDTPLTRSDRAILAHVLKVEPHELDGWIAGEDLWTTLLERLAS